MYNELTSSVSLGCITRKLLNEMLHDINADDTPVVCIQHYDSPCGELILASAGNELCLCDWKGMARGESHLRRIRRYVKGVFRNASSPVIEKTRTELDEYFAGCRREFDIPVRLLGTDFQCRVWRAVRNIPYGERRSYMEIAKTVGNARGVRAVAQAVGANGICIIIPCHRVVGSNGALTGFAGGLDKKAFLLEGEGGEL